MSFHDLRRGTLLCYQSDLLHQPHGFTTRFGGVSTGHLASMNLGLSRGDDRENVLKNYEILGEAIGFDPHKTVQAVQRGLVSICSGSTPAFCKKSRLRYLMST